MNIAEYSIRKQTITISITFLVLLAGTVAYFNLSRLEDPEFTIKDALVVTEYPGASAQEVAEEVSDKIEKAVQQMGQLKRVESYSARGLSIVTVKIKDKYDKHSLPQVWDELRRKINDVQPQLPSGAKTPVVQDDYGDVYGMLFAITGDGYSRAELKEVAKFLQRELLLCPDVKRIEFWGFRNEAIYIEMSREKMAALGVSPTQLYTLLAQKNLITSAGKVKAGSEYITLTPTGNIASFKELGDLLISKDGGRMIFLNDVAEIKRDYVDPPVNILRFNGKPAVGFSISTVLGGNAVTMGDAVLKRLEELKKELPLGIAVHPVSLQSETVKSAVNDFVINVVESLVIVVAVLLVFMGMRSGLLIGIGLLVTIAGTLLMMQVMGISMERISLGALIIALGMLVDNAIVVTEGMMVGIHRGEDKLAAAKSVVRQTQWPLLGATAISIFAFAAIGTSKNASGEFCGSLFYVMLISLGISWITAVTLTPLLCFYFFNSQKKNSETVVDPYGTWGFRLYRRSLEVCLRHRLTTILIMAGLLALAVWGFRFIDQSFFPASTRNQLMVELWLQEGTHISDTEKTVEKVEKYIKGLPHVTDVVSHIGGGSTRFILTYSPEKNNSAYALLLVSVDDGKAINTLYETIQRHLDETGPDFMANVRKFQLGPGEGGKIQLRISGRDPKILRRLSENAVAILRDNPKSKAIRSDWRDRVKIIKPVFSESPAKRVGITYQDLSNAILENFSGINVGTFRENDELISIIARSPQSSRGNAKNLENVFIWSDSAQKMVPSGQVISETVTTWEDPLLMRRHRLPTITIHCDPARGSANQLLQEVRPKIEAMPLPAGYFIEWGGEYEDTIDAQTSLFAGIPVFAILMVLTVILLFNSYRQTLVIWLTVPMAIIGVTLGLLLFNQPFNFMALLGFISLSGMQIKNAIILLDEINCQRAVGDKSAWNAVLDSSVSRIRPVSMAAFTTVLGMLPLLLDAFFIAMSVTIMFGLTFACILTLYVVPVIYSLMYGITDKSQAK